MAALKVSVRATQARTEEEESIIAQERKQGKVSKYSYHKMVANSYYRSVVFEPPGHPMAVVVRIGTAFIMSICTHQIFQLW